MTNTRSGRRGRNGSPDSPDSVAEGRLGWGAAEAAVDESGQEPFAPVVPLPAFQVLGSLEQDCRDLGEQVVRHERLVVLLVDDVLPLHSADVDRALQHV